MLHELIHKYRDEILRRAQTRAQERASTAQTVAKMSAGIPLFVDDLITTLRGHLDRTVDIDRDAALHGELLFEMGYTVSEVVQTYGDVCQTLTQLAIELEAPIDNNEFRVLNRCLDEAIARAVTEFARVKAKSVFDADTRKRGFLVHELRNCVQTAMYSFEALKSGTVGVGGSTGAILGRSLAGLKNLVDGAMAELRSEPVAILAGNIEIAQFLEEVEAAASGRAKIRHIRISLQRGDGDVQVYGDRHALSSAVLNLLQNAIKFTPDRGAVTLTSSATISRVLIEVRDECGGLLPGFEHTLFTGAAPSGTDRSGLGLGLLISRSAVEQLGGTLSVRDLPGDGCVFSIDLPRVQDPEQARPVATVN